MYIEKAPKSNVSTFQGFYSRVVLFIIIIIIRMSFRHFFF